MGGYKPKKISGKHRDWLLERYQGRDFTVRGLVAELAERGLKVDYRSVWEFVHAEKLSFKKKRRLPANSDRPDVARRRAQWVKVSGSDRSWAAGLHRRDLDQDQYGAAAGLGAVRHQRSQPKSRTATGRP